MSYFHQYSFEIVNCKLLFNDILGKVAALNNGKNRNISIKIVQLSGAIRNQSNKQYRHGILTRVKGNPDDRE